MRSLTTLTLILMSLLLGVAATACSSNNGVSSDYYENDTHGGYPGPGVKTQGRDD